MDLTPPSHVLENQTSQLTSAELHQYDLCSEGSKLMTTKGLPLGGIACPVSCLYFGDYNTLTSFLHLPGNTQLGRRVIQV